MSADQERASAGYVEEMAVRIAIDAEVCVGSQMCTSLAPHLFEQVAGVSRPRGEVRQREEAMEDAIEQCPVQAISARNAATGHIVLP